LKTAIEICHTSSRPQTQRDQLAIGQSSSQSITKIRKDPSSDSSNHCRAEQTSDRVESSNSLAQHSHGVSHSFPTFVDSYGTDLSEETVKNGPSYLPFPCPFCDRAYTSWGFRRRHIKAVHTVSPSLNCKWCLQVSF